MPQNCSSFQLPVIHGTVESIAFGGQGILRHEGMVVFVPYTAPGDVVEVQLTRKKKNYAEGRLVRIIEAALSRTTPRCPYYGTCGGCQLQHLSYDAQLEAKKRMVVDAIERIGRQPLEVQPEMVPAEPKWNYRRRVRWSLRLDGDRYRAGYIAIDDRSVVEAKVCPIFVEDTDTILDYVRQAVSRLVGCYAVPAWVSILKNGTGGYVVFFDFRGAHPKNMQEVSKELLAYVTGVVIRSKKGVQHFGLTNGMVEIDGLKLAFSALSFVQAHPEQSERIYRYLRDLAVERKWCTAIELYCGIGVTSLLLAREGIQVRGAEVNSEAIQLARENAHANTTQGALFECGDVAHIAPKWLRKGRDGLIINPPRTGMDPVTAQAVIDSSIKELVYMSCMPATLARDIARLKEGGFALKSVRLFDMFPQTTHLESVAVLERK